jgi:hypothetical protein
MRLFPIALLICLATTGAAAQQVDLGAPPILQLPGSTRALGLGGAYLIGAADPDAIFFNPVLLQNARGVSLAAQRYGSASTLTSLAFTTDVGLGVAVRILDYAPTRASDPLDFGSPIGLSERGFNDSGEALGVVGYMRTIKKIRLGVAGKWVQHWGIDESEGVAAFDIGSTVNPFNWLSVALAVQDIGGSIHFGNVKHDIDTRALLLVSTRTKVVGILDVALAARLQAGEDSDPAGGLGMEASYWPFSGLTFFARAGARFGTGELSGVSPTGRFEEIKESNFTGGAGVAYGRVSLDYAWEPFSGAADSHRFGVRVR